MTVQVLSGTEVRINESFFSSVLDTFEKIYAIFESNNKEDEIDIGLFRYPIPDYDKRAFREALVNAICHRDYSRLGRVRVQIADDGMSISNPGGFIEGINIKNLLNAEPYGRNPVLADALKRIGLAERTGRGIDRIYEGSLKYGRFLPDYSSSNETTVKLYIPKGISDKEFIKLIVENQKNNGYNLSIFELMVLNSLKELKRANITEITDHIYGEANRVRTILTTLVSNGIVDQIGTGKTKTFMLNSVVYKQNENGIAYIRHKDIDEIRYQELILELIKRQGAISRSDVVKLLRVTSSQANRILKNLLKKKKYIVRVKAELQSII